MPYGSPVATDPQRVFDDLRDVAARVRGHLEAEISESVEESPAQMAPAGQISRFAQEERARVLEAGVTGLEKLAGNRADEIDEDEYFGVEAIVLLEGRPAILVQGQDFVAPEGDWSVLDGGRAAIRDSLGRVGRVEVTGHPSLDWVGTAFLVGPRTVMTNRHVAVEFSRTEDAGWSFQQGMSARVDPGEELPAGPGPAPALGPAPYAITEVIGIHPEVDMALLRVVPPDGAPLPSPLAVAADAPATLPGRPVYVIGYPAWDGRRNEPESMRRIFMDVYNVKRLQPGTATEFAPGGLVMKHDCSTLGGNSGSPVFDLADHRVLGLHFGGRYGLGNFAVPLWELVDDPLLARAEVNWV
ncbi:trypsin-like peptidase domain-containing protein [Streptomyces sp. ISL-36]|uniref:trypsin-like serine peptidase n=1 Tax=Streptomyces sp. ISL-36 TaxID=2819182 RepID=UPI001BEB1C18|nr:serine protease [Streptomyces sp. ISL-36]MBT2443121.1 trypsin-like peptidase domain-containing protein [Streptomyces sp. ISL-36]